MARRTHRLDHATKGTGVGAEPERTYLTPLPPGHVRKKVTGELGKVRALDPKAGTVTVAWLKSGNTSTVPLASVTRR